MPRQDVIVRLFCVLSIVLLVPHILVAQTPEPKNSAEAAQQRAAAEQKLEKAKKEVEKKEKELAEQKKTAEDAEKKVNENLNVDDEIKKLEAEIRKLGLLKNKVLNGAALNGDEKDLYKGVMGGDTAPVAPELRVQIIESEIKAKKEKLKELKKLQADPDRDKKRKAAEEKLKKANSRIQELETELENDRAELTKLADEIEAKRKAEARLREEEKARAARKKKTKAEAEAKAAKKSLDAAVEEQKAALQKVNEERKKIEARKELAKLMAKGFRLISDAAKKLAKLGAGDLGEAIAELATLQLKIGADILDELDGLISKIDGVKRLPNGHYVATKAGDIQLHELIEALNKLVDANKKLKAALDRAKRTQQALAYYSGSLETIQRQQKQMNESFERSKVNDASFSFMPNSHSMLTTSKGLQRLAIVNDFARRDDLAGLRSYLKNQASSISAGDANGEAFLVQSLAANVVFDADRTIDLLMDAHASSQAAATPVAAANEIVASLESLSHLSNTRYQGLPIDSIAFREDVVTHFIGSIVDEIDQRVAQSQNQPPVAGLNVFKEKIPLPKQGGTIPDVVVTASFSLFDDEGEKQAEQSQVTKPDADGNYEFDIPKNSRITELKIASPNLVEVPSMPAFESLLAEYDSNSSNEQTSPLVMGFLLHSGDPLRPGIIVPGSRSQRHARQLDDLMFSRPGLYPDPAEDPFRAAVPQLVIDQLSKVPANASPAKTSPDNRGTLTHRPRGMAFVVEHTSPEFNIDRNPFLQGISQIAPGYQAVIAETIMLPNSSDTILDVTDSGQQPNPNATSPENGQPPANQTLVIIKWQWEVGLVDPIVEPPGESIFIGDLIRDNDQAERTAEQIVKLADKDAMIRRLLEKSLAESTLPAGGDAVILEWVEPDVLRNGEGVVPGDPNYTSSGSWEQEYADQWALHRVGGDPESKVWSDESSNAETCIVAVVGSGVDWTHPELMGQMWRNLDEIPGNGKDDDENGYIDDVWGWNFRSDNARVMDQGGHDTHIAGVIAARWDDHGIAGVNPHARIMALKVANQLAQGDSISIARAIIYAADNGARVINVSYGGPAPSRVEQAAIHYATDKGALVVVAAGNKAKDASKYALAGASGVLTVAGTTLDDERAPFSNYGFPIDISAPAMDVLGLRARGTDFLLYVGENNEYEGGTGVVGKDSDLYRASGTSFAAPFVSGAASLLFSQNPSLTNHDVAAMLLSSVTDVEVAGADQYTGFGLLNMQQAMHADPNDFSAVTISKVAPARVEGKIVIQVNGSVSGARLEERRLQVAFGENPNDKDWVMVLRSFDRKQGILGDIPVRFFTKKGVWSIRVTTKTLSGSSSEARATININ